MNQRPIIWRFGAFELDARSGELRKGGVRLRIEDKPLRLLEALLERPGEVLSREELKSTVWPQDTVMEFDRSLTRAINKVRATLSDSAATPRFIETLPRRGYRFVAPVTVVELARAPAEQSERARLYRWIAGGSAFGAALGVTLAVRSC